MNDNREMMLEHLRQAEAAVVLGAGHLARQEEIVAELRRDGHDTKQAEDLLDTFRDTQLRHVEHLELIQRELRSDL